MRDEREWGNGPGAALIAFGASVSVPQSGLTAAADMHPHAGAVGDDANRKTRNWKLIVDPLLQKGGQKVYRTEGLVAGV